MQQAYKSKLKTGDEVVVMTGKDKGKKGKITQVITKTNRVVVAGLNTVKKHISQQAAMQMQVEAGVITKEMPIAISNVMLADPKSGKPTRVGYRIEKDGSKVRVAKQSGEVIDTIKKAAAKASSKKGAK